MNIAKYETENYYIFLDKEVINYENLDSDVWTFIDIRNGHTLFFDTEKEAYNYLKEYHNNEVKSE
tara:strand:+ start:456 stop:650 length:195 start_codon:yes stop_codon:yes gene_type:complete